MSDKMKNRYIEYLIERLENADLDNRAMKLVLEDLTLESSQSDKKLSEILDRLNDLESMLAEERKWRKLLERENQKLKERLKSFRKECFGSKKQSVKEDASEGGHDTPDRLDEKDSFDGTSRFPPVLFRIRMLRFLKRPVSSRLGTSPTVLGFTRMSGPSLSRPAWKEARRMRMSSLIISTGSSSLNGIMTRR